ncbi:Predicted N-acyltransferase, GNAT family [Pilibacter termitis]|uniref:Predicted N-acyltransferase, GNAT family n=1 Tax=Pilibacter termitis TaxID=263852 RepID=A0A1T4QTG4_9ENTE|nr:GNAT family N-acetyltransferase [Pilibacter termitis]SKA06887.1 Predicted N-acyltransferase, GNAT family [Pilibacter termitis]
MKIVHTRDTLSNIYLDSVKIRYHVFVEEQKVPSSMEIDKDEAYCVHFVLYSDTNIPLGTVRFLPNEEEKTVILQRLAVLAEHRKKGYGALLIQAVEEFAKELHFPEITLHAQLHAFEFYQKLGYVPFGEEFEEAGIRHISMKKAI